MKRGFVVMKKMILVAMTVVVGLVLASCGSDQKAEGQSEMHTYTMPNGKKVEIPNNPKKIVVTEYMGSLAALGVKPIGAKSFVLQNPYLEPYKKGVEDIGDPGSPEKVAELQPDLIIVSQEDEYNQMKKIAPTVLIPYNTYKNVQDELTAIGKVVGKEQEAKDWLADFDKKAAKAREEIKGSIAPDATVGLYEGDDKNFYVFGDNWGRGGQVLYNALQLKAPQKIQDQVIKGDGYKQLSLEVLPDFAADYMFVTRFKHGDSRNGALDEMEQSSIWKDLPAYKAKHIYTMDFDEMYNYDPIAIEGQMEILVNKITGKE
ncbi:iron-hydroxamate ABC transporter substrate-binding protein [Listeria booriae]|uniref:iron-hydroxamate ABC transporter substrate-binding protein n=1 Tax=Listeria booriae TaxID=1552123 RepID=UPI001624C57F|nr:iron-hydroxamate ABC transporter substrate-binding protein [Listeria booriae]MBC2367174.1 iron-hydroxamate ABC transporter substrate-binding protein [Listeria booriae]MBC2389597.1 iron-hydroxamate ABC transporter substrate-binding protein [Listeria booriae]